MGMCNDDLLIKARELADAAEDIIKKYPLDDTLTDLRFKDKLKIFRAADRAHSLALPWTVTGINGTACIYDGTFKHIGRFDTKDIAVAVCEAMNKGMKS